MDEPSVRSVLSALSALAFTLLIGPQTLQAQRVQADETFSDEVTVFEVEVPVQVFRDGEPVRGLTRDDFTITYRGKTQDIVSFEVADVSVQRADPETGEPAKPISAAPVEPEMARALLLLFDFQYQSRGLIARSVESARTMVAEALHPSDRVAVAALGGRLGARMYTGFTADRARTALGLDLVDAVADAKAKRQRAIVDQLRATAPSTADGQASEYGLAATVAFGDGLDSIGVFARPNVSVQGEISGARAFDSGAREDPGAAEIFAIGEKLAGFNVLRDAQEYAEALGNLGTLLSGVEGQKLAALFSQGPPLSAIVMGAGQGATEGTQMVTKAMDNAFGQLVRGGWQIHALGQGQGQAAGFGDALAVDYDISTNSISVDAAPGSTGPSGVIAPNYSDGGNTLWYLASGTGGKAYLNSTVPAVDEFLETTSVTYVLRFLLPGVSPTAGKESFNVRLADAEAPARLQYRDFFYSPKERGDMNEVELRIADAREQIRKQSDAAMGNIEFTAHVFADLNDPETAWLSVHLPASQLRRVAQGTGEDSSGVTRLAVVAGVEKGGPAGEVALDQTLTLEAASIASPPADGLTFAGRLDLSVEDVSTATDIRVAVELGTSGAALKVPLQRWTREQRFDSGMVGPFFLPPGLERLIVRGNDRAGDPVSLPLKAPGGAELVPLPFAEVEQGEQLGVMLWTMAKAKAVPGQSGGAETITVRAQPYQAAASGSSAALELERRGDVGDATLWFAPLETKALAPGVYQLVGVDFDNPGVGFFRVLAR